MLPTRTREVRMAQRIDITDGYLLLTSSAGTGTKLTAKYPRDNEKVIHMESFRDKLKETDCDPKSWSLTFKEKEGFDAAKQTWDWVKTPGNHFVMFVPPTKCLPRNVNKGKPLFPMPFNVTHIEYDEKNLRVSLSSRAISYIDAIRTGSLRAEHGAVDSKLQPRAASLDRRARWELPISLNRDLNPADNSDILKNDKVALSCTKGSIAGQMGIALGAEWAWYSFGVPVQAYYEVWADGFGSNMHLALKGEVSPKYNNHIRLWNHEFGGFGIPVLAYVSFDASFGVGYDIGVKAKGEVTWGGTSRNSKQMHYKKCFWGCDDINSG